jgi:putative oxygen-independent coproporphyrinogen III oxidase
MACHYCNFHFSTSLSGKEAMIDALVKEVTLFKKTNRYNITEPLRNDIASSPADLTNIETIYFGGGTPSLLSGTEIRKIMEEVMANFPVTGDAEVTLEANPDDINTKNLMAWKDAGINRLSIGVQSFSDRDLKWMNRAHDASQAIESIKLVREAGFENFSVDLIYGTPGLSSGDWEKNVQNVIAQKIPHLSCYALTVEAGTALKKMINLKKREDVDAEEQRIQFLLMVDLLQTSGYEHYEISNFAMPGARSKHNSGYWQGKPYIGFGPSAHSYDGKSRWWNVSNNAAYIKSIRENIIPSTVELLSVTQQLNEYIMTSIRTIDGMDLNFINDKFGIETGKRLLKSTQQWQTNGKAKIHESRITLTKEGKLFADGIAADLFFQENLVSQIS